MWRKWRKPKYLGSEFRSGINQAAAGILHERPLSFQKQVLDNCLRDTALVSLSPSCKR